MRVHTYVEQYCPIVSLIHDMVLEDLIVESPWLPVGSRHAFYLDRFFRLNFTKNGRFSSDLFDGKKLGKNTRRIYKAWPYVSSVGGRAGSRSQPSSVVFSLRLIG